MKMKITALVLSLAMLFTCLAGCGDTKQQEPEVTETTEPTQEPAGTAEPSESPAVTEEPVDYFALFAPAYARHEPDDIVMTVNGAEVTWSEYFYWLFNYVNQIEGYIGDVADWSAEFGTEQSYQDYLQTYIEAAIAQYHVVEQKFAELGLELEEELQTALETSFENLKTTYGDGTEEGLYAYLETEFITPEVFEMMERVPYQYEQIFRHFYGAAGEKLSEEDVLAFAGDNGYMHCKHILFATADSEGTALDETAVAEKRAQAETVLAELKACTDNETLLETFDKYMTEYTEDPGTLYYLDGYCFGPGEMVAEFETAAAALEEYGVSDIVETEKGMHIILRLPLDVDGMVEYPGTTLRTVAAGTMFSNSSNEWFSGAQIEYREEFAELDFNTLLEGTDA